MNTGLRGDSAVLLVASKLSEAGFTVLKPVSECLRFDLVIFDSIRFNTLQVKRAYPARAEGKFQISTRRVSMTATGAVAQKYTKDDADFIIGVIVHTGDVYCIPIEVAANRNSFTLNPSNIRSKFVTNKQSTDIELFKNVITVHNTLYKL